MDHVVLASAAVTDSANPIRSRRSSRYHHIIDRANILRVAMSAKEFVWSEKEEANGRSTAQPPALAIDRAASGRGIRLDIMFDDRAKRSEQSDRNDNHPVRCRRSAVRARTRAQRSGARARLGVAAKSERRSTPSAPTAELTSADTDSSTSTSTGLRPECEHDFFNARTSAVTGPPLRTIISKSALSAASVHRMVRPRLVTQPVS